MSEEGEFERQIKSKIIKVTVPSDSSEELLIRIGDLSKMVEMAKADFPKKEEAKIIGSDSEEHCYETYDTEAIERWFLRWFGNQNR
jgi:hypothetical protein